MIILGIETSCDETAASLLEVKRGQIRVLSNIISSQIKLHAKYGGVVPSLAAREHVKNLPRVLRLALNPKRYTLNAIDLIAVTRGPGLVSSLLVGTAFAKTLAWKYGKPIIGVNHLEGHLASNWLAPVGKISNFKFPTRVLNALSAPVSKKKRHSTFDIQHSIFPALCLIVSGGHTQLVLMQGFGKYKLVGETLDDAAGEAFDKIARILDLGYPGGPLISAAAEKFSIFNFQFSKISLPRPMIKSKDLNFSFAGLKTAVLYLVRDLTKSPATRGILAKFARMPLVKLAKDLRSAIAAEAQQAIVDVLVSKTIRAAEKHKAKSIMLSGGVSANKLLRSNLNKAAEPHGLKFFKPEVECTTDNAAMIALAGYWNYVSTKKKASWNWQNVTVNANLNI